eukprot:gene14522-16079_t
MNEAGLKNFTLTAASSGFVTNFFAASRLHHLSTWKSDLIDFVAKHSHGKKPSKHSDPYRVIMHVDMDCFFASVGLRDRPDLKGKPVAVAHSTGGINLDNSSSEIASCNYEARARGIKNGMFIGSIKKLAPDLIVIPYEFDKYDECTKIVYQILLRHADFVQAVSCDEAYIDVTAKVKQQLQQEGLVAKNSSKRDSVSLDLCHVGGEEEDDYLTQQRLQEISTSIAETIRREIFEQTGGCPASVGISYNLLLARLATQRAKPNGMHYLAAKNIYTVLNPLTIHDLPGFGHATVEKCRTSLQLHTCEDVRKCSLTALKKELGEKTAECLYQFAHGIDDRVLENKPRQSIGSDINWGVRLTSPDELRLFLLEFTEEVYQRLNQNDYLASHVTVTMKKRLYEGEPGKFLGCGHCQDLSKAMNCVSPIKSKDQLHQYVTQLVQEINIPIPDIRGVGIHLKKLVRKSQPHPFHPTTSITSSSSLTDSRSVSLGSVVGSVSRTDTNDSVMNETVMTSDAVMEEDCNNNTLKRKKTIFNYFMTKTLSSTPLPAQDITVNETNNDPPSFEVQPPDSNRTAVTIIESDDDEAQKSDVGVILEREDSNLSCDTTSSTITGNIVKKTSSTASSINFFQPMKSKAAQKKNTSSGPSPQKKGNAKTTKASITNYFHKDKEKIKDEENAIEEELRANGID